MRVVGGPRAAIMRLLLWHQATGELPRFLFLVACQAKTADAVWQMCGRALTVAARGMRFWLSPLGLHGAAWLQLYLLITPVVL